MPEPVSSTVIAIFPHLPLHFYAVSLPDRRLGDLEEGCAFILVDLRLDKEAGGVASFLVLFDLLGAESAEVSWLFGVVCTTDGSD